MDQATDTYPIVLEKPGLKISESKVGQQLESFGLELVKIINHEADISPYQTKIKELQELAFSPQELFSIQKVNKIFDHKPELLNQAIGVLLDFQRKRLTEIIPTKFDSELQHISEVTDLTRQSFNSSEFDKASAITVLAASVHDIAKWFHSDKQDGPALFNLGLHDLIGAEIGSQAVKLVLQNLQLEGVNDTDLVAVEKLVKLTIAVHGKNEFPILEGRRQAKAGKFYDEQQQILQVYGVPVFVIDTPHLTNMFPDLYHQAMILNGLDMAVGCNISSFLKYHNSDTLDTFKNYENTNDYFMQSYGKTLFNNLNQMDSSVLRTIQQIYGQEIVTSAVFLTLINHPNAELKSILVPEISEETFLSLQEIVSSMTEINFAAADTADQLKHRKLFAQAAEQMKLFTNLYEKNPNLMFKSSQWVVKMLDTIDSSAHIPQALRLLMPDLKL